MNLLFKNIVPENKIGKQTDVEHSISAVTREESIKNVDRLAVVDDCIKIDIHGPGPSAGEGYDWVKIESIQHNSNPDGEEESMAIRVRSSKQPGKQGKDIAHFFTSDATSTFIIYRHQNIVTSFYHGRNEILNIHIEKLTDNIRNVIMGGVALAGVSEMQWSALIKSFLETEV